MGSIGAGALYPTTQLTYSMDVESVPARVLIVGSRANSIVPRLEAGGYRCQPVVGFGGLDGGFHPDVVVLASTARVAPVLLTELRKRPELRRLPVLIDGTQGWRASLQRLDVDGVAESFEALERQLAASLKARRLVEHDELERKRMELMLELSRLSMSGASIQALLGAVSTRASLGLGFERVAILKAGISSRAMLIDEDESTPIDLAVSPTFRRALETRQPLETEFGWVVPLNPARALGSIVARCQVPPGQHDIDFLRALGIALFDAIERTQSDAALIRKREALEDAYVERYKELIAANSRLRAFDRKKDEIMAILSHDLRAPLNVLLGYAHLLLVDETLTTSQRAHSEAINRAGKKVLSLVENLLERAGASEGPIALFSRVFDVSEVCQSAARELQLLARERHLTLRAETPLSLDVFADDQKIRQVLQNLITNALKHAQGATQVVLRTRLRKRPDGDVALIEICDDGQVDDPNDVLMAFDRSKGLGLSICRDLVERHGGEIWAEAPAERGAIFAFTLPISEGQHPRSPETKPDSSEPLVLLVDDDPIFSRTAAMGLSGHFRVELARDGNQAVERARALLPDVIIMDVFMPNRDALDALRELRALPETANIPVILLSARSELLERIRPAELGAADFLAKPLPPNVLLARVQGVVQRSRRSPSLGGLGNDAETGLCDQLGVVSRLEQEMNRGSRLGRSIALAVLRPLQPPPRDGVARCAVVVRRELQVPDFVGHLGQGVFVVVMPETTAEQARLLIARLVGLLADEQVAYRTRLIDVASAQASAELLLERLLA